MTESAVQTMTLEALRSVPLFASLDDPSAKELRAMLSVREIAADTALFKHGEPGDSMYLIEHGRVRISVADTDGAEVILAELAGGDFFGEMALLDGSPRSADATVLESARMAVLARQDFIHFVRRNPDVGIRMMSAITHRLRTTDEMLRRRVSRNVNVEQAARLTWADKIADVVAEFGGSWKFIGVCIGIIFAWMILNTFVLVSGFDRSPFQMLNLFLAVIASLQAPFIMMSQNRQGEKDRLRADLDYQVNLKNELSLTEVLRRLDVLESERLPKLFEEQNAALAARK